MYDWRILRFNEDCVRAKTSVHTCDGQKQSVSTDGGSLNGALYRIIRNSEY